MLLLHNTAKNIVIYFTKYVQLSYNKRQKSLLNVSGGHNVSNNVSWNQYLSYGSTNMQHSRYIYNYML